MPDNEELYSIDDFSGGTNRRVSTFQQRKNELFDSLNVTFTTVIGGISKRLGILQKGSDLTSTTTTSTSTSTTTTSTSTTTTLVTTTSTSSSSSSSTSTTTTSSSTSTTTTSSSTTTTSTSTSSTSTTTTSTSTSSTSTSSSTSTTTTLAPQISYFDSASNPADNGSLLGPTVTITPPASMVAGDLVVVLIQNRRTLDAIDVTETGGQTWNGLNKHSASGQKRRIFWCRFDGTWTADPVFDAIQEKATTGVMHVFRPRDSANTWAVDVIQVNSIGDSESTTLTISGITTVAASTVTIAVWSDAAAHTWNNLTSGWTTSGSAQYRNTEESDISITAAHLIKTTAGSTGDVTKDRNAAGSLQASQAIVAFKDVEP